MGLQGANLQSKDDSGATGSTLSIKLLGKYSLHVDDHEIELLSRKTKALLGYLALTEIQQESRERLIGLFWSEAPEERARASLRQALHEIRNALVPTGFDGFRTDKLVVGLDRTRVRVDLIDVLKDAEGGSAHPLLLKQQNLVDDILAEVESSDPAFQTWVLARRQTIRDQLIRNFEGALRACAQPQFLSHLPKTGENR